MNPISSKSLRDRKKGFPLRSGRLSHNSLDSSSTLILKFATLVISEHQHAFRQKLTFVYFVFVIIHKIIIFILYVRFFCISKITLLN